jgi:hypothetical protein
MPQQVQLIITMNESGGINVSGPIQNALLCFGLLEMAKVAILDHAEQNKRLVQPATGVVLPKQP